MIAWTLAGNDSGGGAGIAADLRTFHGLGVHGCAVVCALTAQNSRAVNAVHYSEPAMVRAQIQALRDDLPPGAIKLGMLGTRRIIETVAEELADLDVPLICDPLMTSSSGTALLEADAVETLITRLFPLVSLLTPNLIEAEKLCGFALGKPAEIERAARRILAMGPAAVLIKGGHGTDTTARDYYSDGRVSFWLSSPRQRTPHGHGTGCTLASAIAALTADGHAPADALVLAKAYLNQGLALARAVGGGPGPVYQGSLPEQERWIPRLSQTVDLEHPPFPPMGQPIGFYPIIDSIAWLRTRAGMGITTAQLRVKALRGPALEETIAQAVAFAKIVGCRLFINDHWRIALKYGAWGVHLGQEDLAEADTRALAAAGIRLGISTHGPAEMAAALSYQPSYVALGPVFPTRTKQVDAQPRGLERLAYWGRTLTRPLVAIGGIGLEQLPAVRAAGVDGVAVISAVRDAPPELIETWVRCCRPSPD